MILMPTGVLMPVESMSMRVLIGMVQALVRPGNWMACVQFLDQLLDGHAPRATPISGLSMMVVSIMRRAAPGRWRSRPARSCRRPVCTSGKVRDDLVGLLQQFLGLGDARCPGAWSACTAGPPRSEGGMNSDPMRLIGIQVTARTITAATSTMAFFLSTTLIMGW